MEPKTKTLLFILLSFLLGIFCGWLIENRISHRMEHPQGGNRAEFLKILSERLHLNEQQLMQVDSILESRKQKMEFFKKQVLAMRDTTRLEIRKYLDANQNKLFDNMIQEMNDREAKMREQENKKSKDTQN